MKILSATATFGKLEHETLTLEPGLNLIEAPNEWGKSTWCAFLIAMFYGMETRAKSTKTALADKDRYQPWSGSPMAGRVELDWNGRRITIERRTKGRTLFGEFRAYETETGLNIPELTASNCGQMLLGVEKAVFTRAGFLRFSDLPVTQDDALRRRLNALVTTGDESGTGDALAQQLKDLKNRCRHNRTGLLPQAEAQRDALEARFQELQTLNAQIARLEQRQEQVRQRLDTLENHQDALRFAAAQSDAQRVTDALQAQEEATQYAEQMQKHCAQLPSRQAAEQAIAAIRQLHQQLQALELESGMLPQMPPEPEIPLPFQGLSPDAALAQVEADRARFTALTGQIRKPSPVFWILAGLLFGAGLAVLAVSPVVSAILLCAGVLCLVPALILRQQYQRQKQQAELDLHALTCRYGSSVPEDWVALAKACGEQILNYQQAMERYRDARGDLDRRAAQLKAQSEALSCGVSLPERLDHWLDVLNSWNQWADAQRNLRQAQAHVETAQSMARNAQPPGFPDTLDYSPEETARLLSDTVLEQRQIQQQLDQARGRRDALGEENQMRLQLTSVSQRIARLEETYAALELAQSTLAEATAELQRRFAPQIASRAQDLLSRLTGDRYHHLLLGEDLSLSTASTEEDTIRSLLWRSDGTIDQLYLALRLAVAEELTPDAPLVLDDALIRFDDTRLAAALKILREEAAHKQVILFTCQSRERTL